MNPFSNNIIFFDTEFTSFDPYKGEILSIGMVKLNGEELYLEIEYSPQDYMSEWVIKNVLPRLTGNKIPREEVKNEIIRFTGTGNPYLIGYVTEFDGLYLYKLCNVKDGADNKGLPFHWIILDFASMLFSYGIDPTFFDVKKKYNLATKLGLDHSQYKENHALDDAKFLRDAYLKIIKHAF